MSKNWKPNFPQKMLFPLFLYVNANRINIIISVTNPLTMDFETNPLFEQTNQTHVMLTFNMQFQLYRTIFTVIKFS